MEQLIILRSVERITAIIIGGLLAYLGYRLFLTVPAKENSEGKFTFPIGGGIHLLRIGPGVFFSLFGTGIVLASFFYAITYRESGPSKNTAIVEPEIVKTTNSPSDDMGNSALKSSPPLQGVDDQRRKSLQSPKVGVEHHSVRPENKPKTLGIGEPHTNDPIRRELIAKAKEPIRTNRETANTVTNEYRGMTAGEQQESTKTKREKELAGIRDARNFLRQEISILNQLPGQLKEDLENTQRNDIVTIIPKIKLSLMKTIWVKEDWGDFDKFVKWERTRETPPDELKKAIDYFNFK